MNINWYDWLAQLLGTLIGTGVGFALAMLWDRTKERAREARERSATAESILLELRGILNRLDTPEAIFSPAEDQSGAVAADFSIPFLSRSAFDASVHSGRLTLLRPDLQEELSTIYEQIRIMRMHVDNAATSYAKGASVAEHRAVIENAIEYLRNHSDMLKPQIEAACENLRGEANALFGKRSEVKDSHDRYAKIEMS